MKEKLISGAAALLDLPEDQVRYSEAAVYATADPAKKIAVPDIVRKMRERVLVTVGARSANPRGYAINTFGAQFAEVEVDTMTGKVKVLKVVAAHDIGRVLNKKTMESQFYGGITQGVGIALMEQRVMDQTTGKMLNPNLHDYKIPTIRDIPEIEVIIVSDADTKISRVGAKGTGEPAIIPTPGAIANAVYNAIGVRIKSLPITPDKVLEALGS
jgi:xanthine dehydrogenase YagR molybdenum-binding subunit